MSDALSRNFTPVQKLGEGTYGLVHRVVHDASGDEYAVKSSKPTIEEEESYPNTAVRELFISQTSKHQNLVSVYEAYVTPSRIDLLMEYISLDLDQFIKKQGSKLSPIAIKHIMFQLLQGLHQLHQNHFLHRDIKPNNILIFFCEKKDESGSNNLNLDDVPLLVKICDYGLSRYVGAADGTFPFHPSEELSRDVITIWFRPLEVILGGAYGYKADLWSVGCMFAALLVRKNGIMIGDSGFEQMNSVFQVLGTPTRENKLWPEYIESLDVLDQNNNNDNNNISTAKPRQHDESEVKNKEKRPLAVVPPLPALGVYRHLVQIHDRTAARKDPELFFSPFVCKRQVFAGDAFKDPLAFHLMLKLLEYSPGKRFNAAQALNHPYFDEIRSKYNYQQFAR